MSLFKNIKKGISKLFGGGHSSGPTVEKAPEATMQTVQQNTAIAAQKRQQGLLSTLLGRQSSFAMNNPTTNAYTFRGDESANNMASVASNIVGVRRGTGGLFNRAINIVTQMRADAAEATATQATQVSDVTQGTTKKYKKQTTSEFLGM